MNHTEQLENTYGNIKLVRLVYDHHKSDPWIEFMDIKNSEYTDQHVSWDNDDFIFTKFYRFLIRYKCNKLKDKDKKKYDDVWLILNQDVVSELIDMLDYAMEKGWYELKK